VEPQIFAVLDVEALNLIGTREKIRARRHPSRETECMASDRSSQCFNWSRIYFDQVLSKCPHCNSGSIQHYTTADLNHFAHNGVREPF
jgi:hypothetical protein